MGNSISSINLVIMMMMMMMMVVVVVVAIRMAIMAIIVLCEYGNQIEDFLGAAFALAHFSLVLALALVFGFFIITCNMYVYIVAYIVT